MTTPPGPADPVAGQTALVTGAGNGLGRAMAVALGAAGARVVLTGRNQANLETVAETIGAGSVVAAVDTSSEDSVAALAASLSREHVSILVNNAGIAGPVKPLTDVSAAEWDEVFAVNVRGIFLMCRAFLPAMVARGRGAVVNVASVSGKRPLPRRTPYTSSKMAVIGLTTTLAHEVGRFGVTVNTLSPGPVSGARMATNFAREAELTGTTARQAEEEFVSRSALNRMVTETEVASTLLAMLAMPGLTAADVDLSAGMVAR